MWIIEKESTAHTKNEVVGWAKAFGLGLRRLKGLENEIIYAAE